MKEMYHGMPFSPSTQLTQPLNENGTVISVANILVFPPPPNLVTIGIDENAETILYTIIADNTLQGCTRGVQGVAKNWLVNEEICRTFTAYDYDTLVENVAELDDSKQEKGDYATNASVEEKIADVPIYDDSAVKADIAANTVAIAGINIPTTLAELEEKSYNSLTEKPTIPPAYEPPNSMMKTDAAQAMEQPLTAGGAQDLAVKQVRNITISTANPSGGASGDLWFKYA